MSKPLLSRIKMATVGAPSVDDFVRLYTTWLGYTVQAQSTVSNSLAQSWGTPNSAGRQMVTLQSAAMDDVYLRAVEVDPVPGYWAITTWGWSAIEIIVDGIEALVVELKDSDFEHIGGPANLMGGASSIRAAQYKGPAEDVIYLTCENRRPRAINITATAQQGRPSICHGPGRTRHNRIGKFLCRYL